MNKPFIFSLLILFSVFAKAQFPQKQSLGASNTEVYSKGGLGTDSGFVFRTNFPDSFTANKGYLKNIPFIEVYIAGVKYFRNQSATAWVQFSYGSPTVYKQGVIKVADTVKINNNRNISYVNQATSGSSLPPDWSPIGSPSYSVVSGKILFSGNSNTYSTYIQSNYGTLMEKSFVECYAIVGSIGSTDQGLRIGWQSYNPYGFAHSVLGGYVSGSAATGYGKAIVYGSTGSSSSYSDSARVSNSGDTLYIKVTQDGLAYTTYVKNITQGWKLSKTVQCTPSGFPFVSRNSSYPAIYPGAGTWTVYGFNYTIAAPLVTENIMVGNSITEGQSATSEWARYLSMVGTVSLNIGSGGGADVTASVLQRIREIIYIKPKRVLLMIGGNDILFGVPAATWQSNLVAMRDSLVNNGIEVVWLYPTPRTSISMLPLKQYLDTSSTFRSDIKIDTYTPLLGSGTSLNAKYDAGDGTHLNNAGMQQVAFLINTGLHYQNADGFYVAKNVVANNGFAAGTDAGIGSDQFKAGGLIAFKSASTSEYVQIGYEGNYGYVQPVQEGVALRNLIFIPNSAANIGVGETAPTATLDIRNVVSGTANGLNINHAAAFSASGQELRLNFQNAHTDAVRLSMFVHDASALGFKLYTKAKNSTFINATPTIESYGDMVTNFNGPVSVGGYPANSSSVLDLKSTTQGFLPPRMTGVQAEAIISPAEGLMIYATDGSGIVIISKGWWGYDGATWVKLN